MWRWAVDNAIGAGIGDIHVVTNDPVIVRDCAARGWATIANPAAASGIASSIRLAAGIAPLGGRLIIALADMPFIAASQLRDLASADGPAFTRHPDGRSGVPAAFPASASKLLLSLEGDRGAASLDWADAVAIAPSDADTLLDVDTPAALERARVLVARFRGQSLTGDSDRDSRLTFGGSLGRADWRDRRRVGSDRAAVAA